MSAGALLEVDAVDVRYGAVPALRGVSLTVGPGETVALVGPNGAGKTSVLRAVSGLVPLAGGRVLVDGADVSSWAPHRRVRLGLAHVPEGRDLFPSLTVVENLRYGFWAKRREAAWSARLDEVFDWFPALRDRRDLAAGRLSGGEQQMLALGRALMSTPRLLLVDELSLGLAPVVVEQLFALLRQVNEAGTAVLVVEQYVPMALAHTDRAYVIAKGEIKVEKPSAELLGDPALVASYLGARPAGSAGAGTPPVEPPPPPPPVPDPHPHRPRRPRSPRPA